MTLKDLYRELIKNKNVSENDVRDLLIFHQKYKNQTDFFLHLNDKVKNLSQIRLDYKKLLASYPLAYITHAYPFLGDSYYINKDVLIPRPETEELVMLLFKEITRYKFNPHQLKVLDVGTGSGVIATQIAKKYPRAKVYASDTSARALALANTNARRLKVKVKFFKVDTYPNNLDQYNVIISNPPYIKYKKDVDKSVLKYEPLSALMISKDNNVYEKIFSAKRYMHPCLMVFEIAPNLVNDLKKLMKKYLTNYSYNFLKDINNKVRFLSILIK